MASRQTSLGAGEGDPRLALLPSSFVANAHGEQSSAEGDEASRKALFETSSVFAAPFPQQPPGFFSSRSGVFSPCCERKAASSAVSSLPSHETPALALPVRTQGLFSEGRAFTSEPGRADAALATAKDTSPVEASVSDVPLVAGLNLSEGAPPFQRPHLSEFEENEEAVGRPVVSTEALEDFMDPVKLEAFLTKHGIRPEEFSRDRTPSIGEGGRELLRSSLQKFVKGKRVHGGNVRELLQRAHECGLWRLVQRIVAERKAKSLSELHQSFVDFKNAQSKRRKRRGNLCMPVIRDEHGVIRSIIYEPCKYLPVGTRGRNQIKVAISKRIREDASKANSLLEEYGLGRIRPKEATVPELLGMAWVLGLWSAVEAVVRENEAKEAEGKGGGRAKGARQRASSSASRNSKQFSTESRQEAEAQAELSAAEEEAVDWDATCSKLVHIALESKRRALQDRKADGEGTQERRKSLSPHFDPWEEEPPPSTTSPPAQSPKEGPLERIARLVAGVDPTSPEAKPAAAQVVRELVACMQEGLLPPPPPELMDQLRVAAQKLGVFL